ncbi:M23 family metallopeptidase [Haloimpatiens lingqiaonensis]|uniref:M23 family metallopeptidase n=1 Tax=Haloimpatiens lingqiaonensis TaxID=1380675 RepID=UPI0010FE8DF7|nr:M23 family metallopeptidase [Haloimpatiens lingqiaonensis]
MGSYNPQYREYYNSILNKRGVYPKNTKNSNIKKEDFITRRIIRDLTGVLILFIIVLLCKIVITPTTQKVYNYSKKIVNENFDYKKVFETVKAFDFKEFKTKSQDYIEKAINKINKKEPVKQVVKNDYEVPCVGKLVSEFGERVDPFTGKKQMHNGVDIAVKENTSIKVCADGKVKECGEHKELGKYIVIDHGEGIETKYAHLNEILVKKDQKVKKGENIAKSGNTGKSTGPHLHFEIMYMGENKDPKDFLKLAM